MLEARPWPTQTLSAVVAPDSSSVLTFAYHQDTRGYRVYLKNIGVSIDPVSNKGAATFRLLVNGSPHPRYNNIVNQVGDTTNPSDAGGLYLGDHCQVSMQCNMGNGAVGNTEMAATMLLTLVPIDY